MMHFMLRYRFFIVILAVVVAMCLLFDIPGTSFINMD